MRVKQPCIARADRLEAGAQVRDGVVVREEHAALREERVHEGLVHRTLGELPERGPLHQQRMHVQAVGIERDVRRAGEYVVGRDEQ